MSNSTRSSLDPNLYFCYLPEGTGPTSPSAPTCSPDATWIRTLLILNAVAAALGLLLGHQAIRNQIPNLLRSNTWRPWSGIIGFVIHAATIMISTVISRSNGYESNFWRLMGVWAMRPRVSVLNVLWTLAFKEDFLWSLQDSVVTESLLNFATVALTAPLRNGLDGDDFGCRVSGMYPASHSYSNLFGTLNYTVFAACSSAFQLSLLLIKLFRGDADYLKAGSWFHGIDAGICGPFFITATGSLVSGWLFWHGESANIITQIAI